MYVWLPTVSQKSSRSCRWNLRPPAAASPGKCCTGSRNILGYMHAGRGFGCEDAWQWEAFCPRSGRCPQQDALTAAAAGSAGTAQGLWHWVGGPAAAGCPEEHPEDPQGLPIHHYSIIIMATSFPSWSRMNCFGALISLQRAVLCLFSGHATMSGVYLCCYERLSVLAGW